MPSLPVWKIATLATISAFMYAKISYAVIRKTVAVLLQSSLVTAVILDLLFCMIFFSKLSVKIQCCKILNANLCWKREYQLQFGSCINFFCLFYAPCQWILLQYVNTGKYCFILQILILGLFMEFLLISILMFSIQI